MVALSVTVLVAGGAMVAMIGRMAGSTSSVPPLFALDAVQPAVAPHGPAAETASDQVAMPTPTPPEPTVEVAAVEQLVVRESPAAETVTHFNGRPVKPVRTMRMLVTAYSPDARSCGKYADGVTASGYSVWTNGGKLVAADTKLLPFGSLISVPGYDRGEIVPVLDVGGKIKGHRLDVLFPTHARARQWGAQWLDVVVYDYAD